MTRVKSNLVSVRRFNKNDLDSSTEGAPFSKRGRSDATTLLFKEDARAGDDRTCLASARFANQEQRGQRHNPEKRST